MKNKIETTPQIQSRNMWFDTFFKNAGFAFDTFIWKPWKWFKQWWWRSNKPTLPAPAQPTTTLSQLIEKYCKKRQKAFEKYRNGYNDEIKNQNIEPELYDASWNSDTEQENELEKKWKTRILLENTPMGNITMHYDSTNFYLVEKFNESESSAVLLQMYK